MGPDPDSNRALVIGAGLGGLAAAMRLGAKGYRVTVLDRLGRAGGRGSSILRDGHRFDLGPTIITVPHVFKDLWSACGRNFADDVTLTPLDPFYEIRWPDGSRFEASGDPAKMEAQVAALSPRDLPGFRKFLKAAERRYVVGFEGMLTKPMHPLWETVKVLPTFGMLRADRSILGMVRAYIRDPRLRMALSFHPLFIGGDPRHVTSMYALVSHLETTFGVHCAIGGVQAIADAMARVISLQGGEVRGDATVTRIETEGDAVKGVSLDNGESLSAPLVVSNADPFTTYNTLLAHRKKRRWTPAKFKRTRWSMGLFVWYFGTKGTAGHWPDVGQHTILNAPRYEGLLKDIFSKGKLAADMSVYLHRPSVTDSTAAPPGDDTFYALAPVPHLGHNAADWATEAPIYKRRLSRVLNDVIPGFADHLGPEEVFTPETFKDRYLSPHGCGFSIEPRLLQSAWFRPHNLSEELRGLYLVGAGTHPGAGVPGVVASAEVIDRLIPAAKSQDLRMAAE